MEAPVSSAANPIVKRMRSLASRKYRQRESAAVVYGIQPVSQAIHAGTTVQALAYAPDLLQNRGARALVQEQREAGTRIVPLDAGLFGRLSGRDGHGGLAAIVTTRYAEPGEIPLGPDVTVVALDRVRNPGNLGTILRTADATRAAGVILVGPTAYPYDPAAIKASMGGAFQLPIARLEGTAAFFCWAATKELPVVTTATRADGALWTTRLPARLAVLMGSEGAGLAEEDLARGSIRLAIPMDGAAESLNLAVATGVVLYEVWRQRVTSNG